MKKIWFDEAWEEYLYWQTQDKKTIKRINAIIKDIERGYFDEIGKPEPLKGNGSCCNGSFLFLYQDVKEYKILLDCCDDYDELIYIGQ